MKKNILLGILLLLIAFVTVGCTKEEEKTPAKLLKETDLSSYTVVKTVNDSPVYTLKNNGYQFAKTEGTETKYYRDFGSTVYVYESKHHTKSGDTDVDYDYVTSDVESNIDFDWIKSNLLTLTVEDINSDGEFVEKENNDVLLAFMEGIWLDSRTSLAYAYPYASEIEGFALANATLTITDSKIAKLAYSISYNSTTTSVEYIFSNVGSTTIEDFPVETARNLSYYSYIQDESSEYTYVNVEFEGIGTVKLCLFQDGTDTNAVAYLLSLIAENYYKGSAVNAFETGYFTAGYAKAASKTISMVKSDFVVTNQRGVVSLRLTDASDSSKYCGQFVFNLTANSSLNNVVAPVAGVVSGFEVLDQLAATSKLANVTVTVVAGSFEYSAVTFA